MSEPDTHVQAEDLFTEDEVYGAVAQEILLGIDQVNGEWRMPWHLVVGGRPVNAFSGRRFKGGNVLALWNAAKLREWTAHQWASQAAWEARGGVLRPREQNKGTLITVPIVAPEKDSRGQVKKWTPFKAGIKKKVGPLGGAAEGGELVKVIGYKRQPWFNVHQVDGIALSEPVRPSPSEAAEALIRAFHRWRGNRGPALVEGGARAHWRPDVDRIEMPKKDTFGDHAGLSGLEYYAGVLAHESIHAAGARKRLNRWTLAEYMKKKEARAQEELVAEIGAAFLASHFGLSTTLRAENSIYVRGWMQKMKEAKRQQAFFWAVTQAEKAANYVLKGMKAIK